MGKKHLNRLHDYGVDRLDEIRIHLARPEALIQLSVLGLLTGLLAGGVIILFRLLVEGSQDALLPGSGPENYEALANWQGFLYPVLGGLAMALMFRYFGGGMTVLGVARLMERMRYHQGHLTERGFLLQFFGAAFAIISGHSVGREGPHIFLGAAAGSLMGQYLKLPNNAIRTFVACGTAAGVAASFNTPLAGVVFALEVIMMEYTVASFIPVILAAVSATALSNLVFGNAPAFSVPVVDIASHGELGLVVVLGILAGAASAGFIHLLQTVARHSRNIEIWWRMLIAGVLMGLIGILVPGVMGIGYDSVEQALNGQMAASLLLLLMAAKILATSLVIGLGVPGGMIGPTLFIGAMLGAAMAELAIMLPFEMQTQAGFFALLGMGAMMSASLQAPMAALTAMLELTDNPHIILPGMLAVVVAGLTASEVFRKESLFLSMLKASGQDYDANPVLQSLRRRGVASIMERNYVHVAQEISSQLATEVLLGEPRFLLVNAYTDSAMLMPAAELAKYLETLDEMPENIDLLEIPAFRLQASGINLQANCQEAYEQLTESGAEALFVERSLRFGQKRIYGVITKVMVEQAYLY